MSILKHESSISNTLSYLIYFKNMLKPIGFIISICLIIIIFLRMPQESLGLSSLATKTDLLGSPSSAERSLNILTAFGILIYLGIAVQLNLSNI